MIMLLRDKASPTMALLEEWELKMGSEATLDSLMEKLDAIGNQPAVDILVGIKGELYYTYFHSVGSLFNSLLLSNNNSISIVG